MDDDFSVDLRVARLRRGMTQRALAHASGIHQPTIAAIETGRRHAGPQVRAALEAALRARPSQALADHRDEVREVIARHHGADPRVFGSTARSDDDLDSDLGLIVTFPDGTKLMALSRLIRELVDVLGVPVDIVDGRADGPVVEQALAEAVPL